jgi:hypothetical protein
MSHDDDHERWLERCFAGGVDANDPQWSARLADCAECADRWAELLFAASALERAGADLREDVRAAREERDAPGEDRISANALGEPGRRSRRARPATSAVGVLLALAAGIFVWVWTREPAPADPTPSYLGDSLVLTAPVGPGADLSVFRWDCALPRAGWFVVIVRDSNGAELSRSSRLESNEYRPPAGVELPDVIEWRVESHDAAGLREAASARASRR